MVEKPYCYGREVIPPSTVIPPTQIPGRPKTKKGQWFTAWGPQMGYTASTVVAGLAAHPGAGPLLHRTEHQPPGRRKWNLCKSRTVSNRILLDYRNNILTVLLRYTTKTIHLILKDKDTMLGDASQKKPSLVYSTWILGAWDGPLVVQWRASSTTEEITPV